jgi:hypothetical protein
LPVIWSMSKRCLPPEAVGRTGLASSGRRQTGLAYAADNLAAVNFNTTFGHRDG